MTSFISREINLEIKMYRMDQTMRIHASTTDCMLKDIHEPVFIK